ncbi:MAG TPA: hypothetical protein VHJ99_01490 [Candidatus Dormibacteraeota bacterium]|nr:hypothetical protein [Candidatus Dormibacteraeota bacterium]
MAARVPLDVDLEDRLLYGLTPTRLAYLVIALVSAFTLWSSPWAPTVVRAGAALLTIGIGGVASWGRWKGRSADLWLIDIVLFTARSHQVTWNTSWLRWPRRKTSRKPSPSHPAETLAVAA